MFFNAHFRLHNIHKKYNALFFFINIIIIIIIMKAILVRIFLNVDVRDNPSIWYLSGEQDTGEYNEYLESAGFFCLKKEEKLFLRFVKMEFKVCSAGRVSPLW